MTGQPVSVRAWQLLDLLADGEFHSGEVLAGHLGVSRASVFNALDGLDQCGVPLQRIRGRGYRLSRPWQRLQATEIERWLSTEAAQFHIEILPQASSSNTLLLQRVAAGAPSGSVLAVELQTAGRGRMGRVWHSCLGSSLTFSLLWRFECGLNALSGLSLAVGVAVVRALHKMGAQGAQLKWPNDILTEYGKLGGILIEAQGDMLGPSAVVIGIGLNVTLPAGLAPQIGQAASALDEICGNMLVRNQLLALLLQELAVVLRQFSRSGFAPLRAEWELHHFYRGQPVVLHGVNGLTISGLACGVSDSGELRLETGTGERLFSSGDIGVPA